MESARALSGWAFRWLKGIRPNSPVVTFGLGLLIVTVIFAINYRYPNALERVELIASDLRMYARVARVHPTGEVVIAAVDDESVARIGHWPWHRNEIARLVSALEQYKVAAIGLDVIFSEPDDTDLDHQALATRLAAAGVPSQTVSRALSGGNDDAMARALQRQGSTYLGYAFESHRLGDWKNVAVQKGFVTEPRHPPPEAYNLVTHAPGPLPELINGKAYLPPIPILSSAARGIAYVDVDADMDGTIRTFPLVIRFQDRFCVPLFLALVAAYRDSAQLVLSLARHGPEAVIVGNTRIPVDEMGRMLVNFRGPERTIPTYSVADIIDHRIPDSDLAGRIVLVGVTGRGLGDRIVTPVGGDFPGVEVQANAIDNVLRGDLIQRSKSTLGEERFATLILALAAIIAIALLNAWWALASGFLLGAGYILYAHYRLSHGVLVGVVVPLLTLVAIYLLLLGYRYLTEGREKAYLRRVFEHYLSPDVISSVVDNPEGLKLGGQRRVMTILFADIVNYTGLSERVKDPVALVSLLNAYMTKMTDVILKSGGVVDKIKGDGIMAFWGAPVEVANHARAAIDTGLAMLAELRTLQQSERRFGELDIGVGIATGEAVVGNFGGEQRFDYSVIGDTVNFGSRLEGLTRQFKVHLIVSRDTFVAANGAYVARELGFVRVKGKTEALPVVEVVGRTDDGIDPDFYQRFAGIQQDLAAGDTQVAERELRELTELRPGDHVTRMYLDKVHEHLAQSSAPLTSIVFEFDTK